jgi:hypothetical protein
MGIFSGFIEGLARTAAAIWPDLKKVGGSVFAGAARGAGVIIKTAKDFVDGFVSGFSDGMRDEPKTVREHAERELQEVNAEVVDLRKYYLEQGRLNAQQKRRWEELRERRDELNKELSAIDQVTAAQEVVQHEQDFKPVIITDSNAQILQYHVGQNTYNKVCQCGRPMVLQWDRRAETAGLHDFFWGCSGYYVVNNGHIACGLTQKLTDGDLSLFANMNRPEFEVNSSTLTRETINPVKARRIRQALDSIQGAHKSKRLGIATYRCPIHGESLRLKRKNESTDQLLDQYFLGCPRWLPNNAGCNFLVKLKSAAQISSVLNTEQNMGVLSV